MFGGAAIGGLVGGPVGAAVGFMVGGILGDSLGAQDIAQKRADSAEQELTQSRLAFQQELHRTRQSLERELAEARRKLATGGGGARSADGEFQQVGGVKFAPRVADGGLLIVNASLVDLDDVTRAQHRAKPSPRR